MNVITGQTCKNCKFVYSPIPNQFYCRRLPPACFNVQVKMPTGEIGNQQMSAFPPVQAEAWCGEYKPKIALEN